MSLQGKTGEDVDSCGKEVLDDERRALAMRATLRTSRRGHSGAAVRVVSTSSRLRHIAPFVVNIISNAFLCQCK